MPEFLELTDEERDAFRKAFDWMENDGVDWHDLDEGYLEACILARLLNKFAFTILRDMQKVKNG